MIRSVFQMMFLVSVFLPVRLSSERVKDTQRSQLANVGWFAKGEKIKVALKSKGKKGAPAASSLSASQPVKTSSTTAEHEWVPIVKSRSVVTSPPANKIDRKQTRAKIEAKKKRPPTPAPAVSASSDVSLGTAAASPSASASVAKAQDDSELLKDPFAATEPPKTKPKVAIDTVTASPIPLIPPTQMSGVIHQPKDVKAEVIPERKPAALYETMCSCSCVIQSPMPAKNATSGLYRDDECQYLVWDIRGLTPSSCTEISGSGYCDQAYMKFGSECKAMEEMGTLTNCVFKVIPIGPD